MPRKYSMETRAAESEAIHDQILDAVVRVAARSSVDALTVQAVAKEADVAVRTVYNHFTSREALVAAALGDLAERTRRSVRAIGASQSTARERILAFVDAYQRSYEEQGEGIRVLMSALDIPAVADAVTDVRAWRRDQIQAMVRRARREGSLAIGVADAVDLTYLATAYATFNSLVADVGRTPASARAITRNLLARALFTDPDGDGPSSAGRGGHSSTTPTR